MLIAILIPVPARDRQIVLSREPRVVCLGSSSSNDHDGEETTPGNALFSKRCQPSRSDCAREAVTARGSLAGSELYNDRI
jgi:hypothetical protein